MATAAHQLLGAARALTARSVMAAARATRRSDTSVSELLRALAGELSHPVMLLDAGGHVVLDSRPERIGDSPLITELTERSGPTAVDLPNAGVLVAWPVTTGFGPRLWLAASLAAPLPAEQNAILAALEVATSAVGHRLALVRLADERDARHRIALLGELVDAAADVPADLLRRTVDVGWTMEGWHIAVRIVARTEVDAVARRLNVIGALEAEELTVNVVEQADGWAAWLTLAQEPGPSAVESAGSAVRRAQRRLSTTLPTAVGVGRAHPGPSGVAASLAEASDAARLAGNRPETGRFLHIDRLGLAQLLLAWTRNDTFQPAAAELLGSLAAGGRDLLRTLTVYLDTESSLTETAAILGVHRNTIADRIARVQRELSVDLTDPDTRLALHLACRTLADL